MSLGATNRLPRAPARRGFGQQLERRIVLNLVVIASPSRHAAMAVRGVLAKANVRHQHQLFCRARLLQRLQPALHDAVVGPGSSRLLIFAFGQSEEQTPPMPSDAAASTSFTAWSIEKLKTPAWNPAAGERPRLSTETAAESTRPVRDAFPAPWRAAARCAAVAASGLSGIPSCHCRLGVAIWSYS